MYLTHGEMHLCTNTIREDQTTDKKLSYEKVELKLYKSMLTALLKSSFPIEQGDTSPLK